MRAAAEIEERDEDNITSHADHRPQDCTLFLPFRSVWLPILSVVSNGPWSTRLWKCIVAVDVQLVGNLIPSAQTLVESTLELVVKFNPVKMRLDSRHTATSL